MCNCPQEQDDKETVTIFSKCTTLHRPAKDTLKPTASDSSDRLSIHSVRSGSSSSTKKSLSSSELFSESSRTYKFVCSSKCDCANEAEEVCELPTICPKIEATKDIVEKKFDVEYTLAIIKPEAVVYRMQIEHIIYMEGFEICQTRWLQLTPEQVSEFYNDRFGEFSFPCLVAYMSSKPIIALVLAKQKAIEDWRTIIGPTTVSAARLYAPDSIRARFGCKEEDFKNAVHGSESREQAEREIHFFFSNFVIEPLLRGENAEDFLWQTINPVLTEGLISCCKSKPADPLLWLANWLILNNPNKPKLPEDLALIPT